MQKTKIEWADVVWNPITGCTPISEGCDHCYARRMANRLKGRYGYPKDDPFRVTVHWGRIEQPMHWIKTTRVFACSMADIFHQDVPLNVAKDIFDVMRRAGNLYGHTFMVLTKRPKRMKAFFEMQNDWLLQPDLNVWLGVSAENQKRYDERWEVLKEITAYRRFISFEPLLCSIEMRPWGAKPDWVIVGQETGPRARPAKAEWFSSIIDQCKQSGVPVFIKRAPEGVPIIREFPKTLRGREKEE